MRLAYTLQAIGGGFLLAVLWFDLKFDLLAYAQLSGNGPLLGPDLEIIRSYYLRALSSERTGIPLIMPLMLTTIVATLYTACKDTERALWYRLVTPMLVVPPVLLAALRVVPNALALAEGAGGHEDQVALAVSILADHLYCLVSISSFLLLQLLRAATGSAAA